MVHIREYDNSDKDKSYPTKKGVAFTKVRWATFHSHLDEIDRNVDLLKADQPVEYRQHIGGKYYVTISRGNEMRKHSSLFHTTKLYQRTSHA